MTLIASWPEVRLGEACEFVSGGTPSTAKPEYYNGDIPWITGADITSQRVFSGRSCITEVAIRETATNLVPAGTVLLVTRTSVGKVAVAGRPLCFSQDITALLPNPCLLDVAYLVRFLEANQLHFARQSRGATIKGVARSAVAELRIPLPPLPEQRRIASILDQADALRAKRRAAIAQLDTLAQSIFLDMFGGCCSHPWPETTVASIANSAPGSIRTGPFGSQLLHSQFVDEGIAVLGIDNAVRNEFRWAGRRYVSPAKYKELKRYTVKPGDVLITIMGTCGRCAVVPDDIPAAINTKHLCCITLDKRKCLPEFLHAYFLWHPTARMYLERRAKGAIMSGLNMGIIKALPVRLPPLHLQCEFAHRLRALRCLTTANGSSLASFDELFASLQHRAFRGEL